MVEVEDVIPIFSDFKEAGFQPYVLELASLGLTEEVDFPVLALVVMIRQNGVMLALPEYALSAEVLAAGNMHGAQDLVGPSTRVEVIAAVLDEDAILQLPVPTAERAIDVLLVDFTVDVLFSMRPVTTLDDLDQVHGFDTDILVFPETKDLSDKAAVWIAGAQPADRIQFYSADEVPETPKEATGKTPKRRAQPAGSGGGGNAPKASPKKRPTVAQLAESLEQISSSLPAFAAQLQELSARTSAMEAQSPQQKGRQSALRVPLGNLATPGSGSGSTPGALLKTMPPPRSSTSLARPHVHFGQQDAEQMEEELQGEPSNVMQALVEQSKAVNTLVAALASNAVDPIQDLGGSVSSLSSKGAIGRARLQQELAAHKGVFFQAILQQMARRMHPSMLAEVEMTELRNRGVTPCQYLERFGGFGKCRDIGFIVWQLAIAMGHMQEQNHLAAQDAIGLLFVCLEQTAMDSGNMQVGLLLSLQEDPPQTVFSGRSLASGANPRPLAPTACQKWVTTALQYLKELDVISTKRAEATSKGQPSKQGEEGPAAKASTKKKAGKGKAGKGQKTQQDQEEEQ